MLTGPFIKGRAKNPSPSSTADQARGGQGDPGALGQGTESEESDE